ncbi:hypothetical protein BZA02_102267 [Ruegeria sp. P4]|nr:hypothetical protein BZA02_102267 [Ruegeria sp. P4]
MAHSEITNVTKHELVEGHDFSALVTLNVDRHSSLPRIEFFTSEHVCGVYQAPRVLQLRYIIQSDAPGVAFVVGIPRVEAFAREVEALCVGINLHSEFIFDEGNGVFIRHLTQDAEDGVDELTMLFENFIESEEWQDASVELMDTEDFWTEDELFALHRPDMTLEEFEAAVIAAQEAADTRKFKVVGVAYGMIEDAFEKAIA